MKSVDLSQSREINWRALGTRHLDYLDQEDKFSDLFTQVLKVDSSEETKSGWLLFFTDIT